MIPTNSPTRGQPNPSKNIFFHELGLVLYRKQSTRNPTRPNSPQRPYLISTIVLYCVTVGISTIILYCIGYINHSTVLCYGRYINHSTVLCYSRDNNHSTVLCYGRYINHSLYCSISTIILYCNSISTMVVLCCITVGIWTTILYCHSLQVTIKTNLL